MNQLSSPPSISPPPIPRYFFLPHPHSNPERFTGYAGSSARRVWSSIYENSFELTPEEMSVGDHCFEKRIFYRLIAGLQSSISTHLAL